MEYVRLGNSGVKVSRLCLGTWHLPLTGRRDQYGVYEVDAEASVKAMKVAYDLGINFIDTSNRYHGGMQKTDLNHVGNAERIVGKFLSQVDRESVVLATKVRGQMAPWPNGEGLSRKHVRWQLRESLKRLNTDYVDLYQLHWADPDTPKEETLTTLNWLLQGGYVNYLGVSNHPPHEVVEFQEIASRRGMEGFVSMQELYNLLERGIESAGLPVARRYGMAVMAYSPLAQGVLTGKYFKDGQWNVPALSRAEAVEELRSRYFTQSSVKTLTTLEEVAREKGATVSQVALAWLIRKGHSTGVTVIPIVGVSSPRHVEENLAALEVKLSDDDMKRLEGG
ncbi:aldo/keto reductase [Sulfodiicoccus acidiphilus]|nr:aldo/keto reductase [Sulfodiicoccus acidiphilus]